MADLYSIIPGLQPSAQELLEAELLAKQILEAKFPDLDLREGTGLRDLVLRPSALLFALCKKANDYYFTQYTLKGVSDVTPSDIVDGILSNWFLTRNLGIKAIINARLYFARKKNISVSSDVYFSTDNINKFYPTASISFTADAAIYDSYSDEYYVDIDLVAESEGSQYNLGSGSLLYFSNFDPYFLRAEINYLKSESIDSETNAQFINRAQSAISTRNLINVPSVDSNIRQQFNFIKKLVTIGMGQPEMIRDQIKAVFDDQAPRTITSLTSVGTVATVILANHGYNSGQRVEISNAIPLEYNGQYIITVADSSTFTYNLASTAGAITSIPQVKAATLPVLLHNGGMVDVYCSDKLANAIVQLTTDEFGKTLLTGPIYSFTRSSITGGSEEDTIPLLNTATASSISITGANVTIGTVDPHNFIITDTVTISGATQSSTLDSITCSGTTVTATKIAHEIIVGNKVTISGVTPASYNGTFTVTTATADTFQYEVPSPITVSGTGTMTFSLDIFNGEHQLSGISGSGISFTLSQAFDYPVTGTVTITSPTRYSFTKDYDQIKDVYSIQASGKLATVTLNRHGYTAGRYVKITGSSINTFNGTWLIKEILNLDQFTFDIPIWTNATSLVGQATFTIPWYDHGFSQNQGLIIDFGIDNADKTASFSIDYFQNLDSVQSYLDDSVSRILCGDYLARGFNFYYLTVEVTAYNGPAPDESAVHDLVNSYLIDLSPGEMFIMTDMVSKLRLNGITNIQNPPKVTFKKYTRDLNPVETGTITDILDPNDKTSVFLLENVFTYADNITTENTAVVI